MSEASITVLLLSDTHPRLFPPQSKVSLLHCLGSHQSSLLLTHPNRKPITNSIGVTSKVSSETSFSFSSHTATSVLGALRLLYELLVLHNQVSVSPTPVLSPHSSPSFLPKNKIWPYPLKDFASSFFFVSHRSMPHLQHTKIQPRFLVFSPTSCTCFSSSFGLLK